MSESEGRRSGAARAATSPSDLGGVDVGAQPRQYLITPQAGLPARAAGVQPMSMSMLNVTVQGLDVVKRIKRPRAVLATFGVGQGEATDIIVTNMEPERADFMRITAPQLAIGENVSLDYGPLTLLAGGPPLGLATLARSTVKPRSIRFRVLGANDKPLEGAVVTLAGDTVPGQGVTNRSGEVTLDLYTLQDRPARLLSVMKSTGYWDLYLPQPQVSDSQVNIVRLNAYSETLDGFPDAFRYGWGQKLMGLDRLGPGLTGQGVKIAIIDSGADNSHPLLNHLTVGRDFSDSGNLTAWNDDVVGHGSHCAGVITARSTGGLRGFAPDAEVHVLKVFPGGRYDSLIEALNYCIENDIDVVNMSLGGDDEMNVAVEQTLIAAVNSGIACIVAAGNSGDSVKYPARSPNALAVAALGDVNETRPNSWDRSNLREQFLSGDGMFSPAFTCFGPEVAVCAPGVAIISTVPGDAFEAQSGTSMAAPHVTGLAALVLAHHPIFRTTLRERTKERVAGLFSIIKSICVPYAFGSDRIGAGLPKLDALQQFLTPSTAPAEGSDGTGTNGQQAANAPVPAGAGNALGGLQPQSAGLTPFGAGPGPVPVPPEWYLAQMAAQNRGAASLQGADPALAWLVRSLRGW